jgi:hypothetical protein
LTRIRGRYPGGPSREGGESGDGGDKPAPRLDRVEEMEAHVGRRSRARAQRRRSRRLLSGMVVAVALSAGFGVYLGLRAHRTSEQLTEERNDTRELQQDITRETNRVLLELWRMEDVEKQATPP